MGIIQNFLGDNQRVSNSDELYVTVITKPASFGKSDECRCYVFPNGDIKYHGIHRWQRSPRQRFGFSSERRPRDSQLTIADYNEALVQATGNAVKWSTELHAIAKQVQELFKNGDCGGSVEACTVECKRLAEQLSKN